MQQGSVATADSPAGSALARPRRLGLAWGSPRALPGPGAVVSDEQIRALVAAAGGLGRRQRQRCADGASAAADERLLRLDWVARAGGLALADRAAQALPSASATAQSWRCEL